MLKDPTLIAHHQHLSNIKEEEEKQSIQEEIHEMIMREIKEGNVIQDCIQEGFGQSEIKMANDGPTFKNNKKSLKDNVNAQKMTESLTTKISGAVRASIEAQVRASTEHGNSSFLRMLKSLRMSGLADGDSSQGEGLFSEIREEEDEGQSTFRNLRPKIESGNI